MIELLKKMGLVILVGVACYEIMNISLYLHDDIISVSVDCIILILSIFGIIAMIYGIICDIINDVLES